MKYTFKDKLFLVTGGSGFLGRVLVGRLLSMGAKVRVLARNEGKLLELKQLYPSVDILTGDVSDEFEVKQSMRGVSGVFHLAASKHIGIAEKQVRECIKSNTIGSMNILEESLKVPLEFIIGISTDKTAKVSGVYGASKLLMERLFKQYEVLNPTCDYRIVRYGNVLYSTGSVLCKWRDIMTSGQGPVTLTDPDATRFFWTVDQAVDLIFECLSKASNASPFVPDMKGMSLRNLLIAMSEKYCVDRPAPAWNIIGLQPGENLHEKILENGPDSSQVQQYEIDEIKLLI